jgi:hypothetical protein
LGELPPKPEASRPSGDVFQRIGQTCPAAFVQF